MLVLAALPHLALPTFSPSIISYVSSVLAGGKFEVQFMGDAYNHFVCKDYPVLLRRARSLRAL